MKNTSGTHCPRSCIARYPVAAAVFGAVMLLAACGGTAPVRSEQETAAILWDQRGHDAYGRGDYAEALADYDRALAINRAVENVGGIGDELMNAAAVYARLGERERARDTLDEILSPGGIPFNAAQQAEAAYREAVLAFEGGEAVQVRQWLDRARTLCGREGCAAAGRIYNLRARIALAARDFAAAKDDAKRALQLNRKQNDVAEQANSLRLMADASLQDGDPAPARPLYEQALQMDKDTGASAKIALDLMGLGRAAAMQRRRDEALQYFRRAYSVSEGINDPDGMNAAATEIKQQTQ